MSAAPAAPIERVDITGTLRRIAPGRSVTFGRSFNRNSLRVLANNVAREVGGTFKVVEVPEGYMCWRKA